MDESRYDNDPEGIQLADEITKHLGPQLRVFCVQRVNKHFRARHLCTERSYRYYLPVSLLTGREVEIGSKEQQEALEMFRKALDMFVGRHPFHNFTKLKNYKDNPWDMYKVPKNVRQEAPEKTQDTSRVGDLMATGWWVHSKGIHFYIVCCICAHFFNSNRQRSVLLSTILASFMHQLLHIPTLWDQM